MYVVSSLLKISLAKIHIHHPVFHLFVVFAIKKEMCARNNDLSVSGDDVCGRWEKYSLLQAFKRLCVWFLL